MDLKARLWQEASHLHRGARSAPHRRGRGRVDREHAHRTAWVGRRWCVRCVFTYLFMCRRIAPRIGLMFVLS